MVSFVFWSNSSSKTVQSSLQDTAQQGQPPHEDVIGHPPQAAVEVPGANQNTDTSVPAAVPEHVTQIIAATSPTRRSFNFFHGLHHKSILTTEQERKKERQAALDLKRVTLSQSPFSKSDKRAKKSAEIVRSLIIGPNSIQPTSKTKPLSKAQLNKVKSDLAKPRSANKIIAQLRQLNLDSDPSSPLFVAQPRVTEPIHAVCLDVSDEEAAQRHFARLKVDAGPTVEGGTELPLSVVSASIESLTSLLSDLNVISLLSSDFGFGGSTNGPGILSGAVPTAETIINGITMITPQLMSLGYMTGQAIIPDHKGIYPPTDRMSVLTYWWGLEVVLPPSTLKYLDSVQSISHSVINFLTVLAAVHNGVREILPFVRYISQFIEFEFSAIKSQNKGAGVVCAATWIMPVALVPRPWDFALLGNPPDPANGDPAASEPDSTQPPDDSTPTT